MRIVVRDCMRYSGNLNKPMIDHVPPSKQSRATIGPSAKGRFAGGPIVIRFKMLTGIQT